MNRLKRRLIRIVSTDSSAATMPLTRPPPSAASIETLRSGGVPLISLDEACRGCEHEHDCEDTDSALYDQERIWDPLDVRHQLVTNMHPAKLTSHHFLRSLTTTLS